MFRKRLQQDHMLQQTLFNNYHTGLTKAQLPILSSLWRLLVLAKDCLIVNMEYDSYLQYNKERNQGLIPKVNHQSTVR